MQLNSLTGDEQKHGRSEHLHNQTKKPCPIKPCSNKPSVKAYAKLGLHAGQLNRFSFEF